MTVIAVHPNVELYGSDRMFIASVAALIDSKHHVSAIVPGDGPLRQSLLKRGVDIQIKKFPVLRKVTLRKSNLISHAVYSVVSIAKIARYLKKSHADVLYVSTLIQPVWAVAGRLAGMRVVCHVHENEPGMSRIKKALLLGQLRFCHLVIANSQATQLWLQSNAGQTATTVIYNGVGPFVESDVALVASSRTQLLVIGRISERKGQDVAIEAVALLVASGYEVDLTIVGDVYAGYDTWLDELRETVSRKALNSRVSFVGWQSDPQSFYQASDIVIVPSRLEPFGNVAVEAMLAKRPVIASAVQGLREIVEHEVSGLLVMPGDARQLAASVARLIDNPGEAESLARRAYGKATSRYSLDQYDKAVVDAVCN